MNFFEFLAWAQDKLDGKAKQDELDAAQKRAALAELERRAKEAFDAPVEPPKRGGRPKGSKNKPKAIASRD